MTVRIMLDTSVWLLLAGDFRNLPLLHTMSTMMDEGEIEFLVPDVVIEEFNRNRERVLRQAKDRQNENFKRVRGAIKQFGEGDTRALLQAVMDVEHKIYVHGEATNDTMANVEDLLRQSQPIVPSTIARSRAANRGLDRVAPFHTSRNSITDAVILETYLEVLEQSTDFEDTFAFVTTNTNDFSDAAGDKRKPHLDLARHFDGERSTYGTDLAQFFHDMRVSIDPDGVFEEMFFAEDPRLLSEINSAIDLLWHQVWYNRHLNYMHRIESGEITVVNKMSKDFPFDRTKITGETLKTVQEAGARVAEDYKGQLGPWDDFEWGMINGKLSALRWVLGEEWDFLDT